MHGVQVSGGLFPVNFAYFWYLLRYMCVLAFVAVASRGASAAMFMSAVASVKRSCIAVVMRVVTVSVPNIAWLSYVFRFAFVAFFTKGSSVIERE